jgi:hypothetical protein
MARVTAYEASDGTLLRDRKEYLRHESNLLVAKKLQPIIEAQAGDTSKAGEILNFIVKGIGLNTLRDLFAIQFKPGAEDGDGENAGGAPAAEAGAPAEAGAAAAADAGGDI